MLTQYFVQSQEIKSKLVDILEDELRRREHLGLHIPQDVNLNLVLEDYSYVGRVDKVDGAFILGLNILKEIEQDLEARSKYESKLAQIYSWIRATKALVPQDRIDLVDNGLIEFLVNPNSFDGIDLAQFSPEGRQYFESVIPQLKQDAPTILDYIHEIIQNTSEKPLDHLRSTIRHELEHTDPEYRRQLEEMDEKLKEINEDFRLYRNGSRHLSNEEIRHKTNDYLSRAAILFTAEEARAFFCQYFDPETDTKETLKQKKQIIEQDIVSGYINADFYKGALRDAIVRQIWMELANEGKMLDDNTINYVSEIHYRGTGIQVMREVNRNKVDMDIATRMFAMLGFWEYKFKEGMYNGLDMWESFYANKLSKGA